MIIGAFIQTFFSSIMRKNRSVNVRAPWNFNMCFCFREEKPAWTKKYQRLNWWNWTERYFCRLKNKGTYWTLVVFRNKIVWPIGSFSASSYLFDETKQSPESAKLGRFSEASPGSASVSDRWGLILQPWPGRERRPWNRPWAGNTYKIRHNFPSPLSSLRNRGKWTPS